MAPRTENRVPLARPPGRCVWITGLAGSGKTTLAEAVALNLQRRHRPRPVMLDGDVVRSALPWKLGYDLESRRLMGWSYAQLSNRLARQGHLVVVSTISLFHEIHEWNRDNTPGYFEVFLDVAMAELQRRDKKGLYSGAEDPELVVGLGQNAEYPVLPDLTLDTASTDPKCGAARILSELDSLD